jgi:hypothetical protein
VVLRFTRCRVIRSGGTDRHSTVDTLYVMSNYRYRGGAVLLMASLVLAACATGGQPSVSTPLAAGGTIASPAPNQPPPARFGVPFRNGSFEVTVTRVETGVRQLDISDAAKSGGHQPWTPANGQYVVVYLTARNVSDVPAACSTSDSGLVDEAGRTYISAALVGGTPPLGQGLGSNNLQPGASGSGFVAFDVPTSAGAPATLVLRTKVYGTSASPPTTVNLRH